MEIEPSSDSSERFKLYDELELHEFQDKFVIKSHQCPDQGFWISRRDGNINLLDGDTYSESSSTKSTIYGLIGTIRLVVGTYAIVITSRKEVGRFLGFPVYRVMSIRVLACNEALKFSTIQEKRDEAYFMNLLKEVGSMPGLYYSYETDITLNLERRSKLVEGWMNKPIWKQADPRYVWNKHLLEELIEFKLDRFIMPLVQGSFQAAELKLKDSCATVTLVSRRCTRRLGTRMWRRGANLEGDTANFIETEQLLEIGEFRFSFLQIRGSIPLLWEQIVDLSYKPHLRIISHEQTPNVVERHFHDLFKRYGEIMAVDLTDKHGEEGQLSAAYAAEMQSQQNVRYVPFDFHHHCGSSNFDNLKILYDQISEDFEKQRYFMIDREGNISEEQRGIIRANCIDSLDRTNVTQSYLAQKSLNLQLQRIGVFTCSECISMFGEEYGKFRTLWAEQGDEISLEYAGTHALKGDLVRYGNLRPAWRVDAARVDTHCDFGLLVSDHSIFAHGSQGSSPSISVEIKPKCGFLPLSRFISEENAVKKRITRFQMHQALKLHQGEISQQSVYNPLDLFSGSGERIYKGVKDLFTTPQNNFRVFLDGSLILGGLGGGTKSTDAYTAKVLEDELKSVILADDGVRTETLFTLVTEALQRSGVLDQLLAVQKLDNIDIEGVIHAYYDITSQECMVCRELSEEQAKKYTSVHSASLDESLRIVKDYLIAATAKDCSLMICFRPRKEEDSGSVYSHVYLESTQQAFDFKVYFIDLDLKRLGKMEEYYELDKKIVSCYKQMIKMDHGRNEVPNLQASY